MLLDLLKEMSSRTFKVLLFTNGKKTLTASTCTNYIIMKTSTRTTLVQPHGEFVIVIAPPWEVPEIKKCDTSSEIPQTGSGEHTLLLESKYTSFWSNVTPLQVKAAQSKFYLTQSTGVLAFNST